MRTDSGLDQARDHYFPGWRDYEDAGVPEPLKPLYRVSCTSLAEAWEATAAKPAGVRAIFQEGLLR